MVQVASQPSATPQDTKEEDKRLKNMTGTGPAASPSKSNNRRAIWPLSTFERDTLILSTTLKLLLYPAYRSTDFEVHRNWLAITHSLPLHKWYYEATSEWTLDYPPFFAYFEWLLSQPAALIDKNIVDVTNLGYSAWSVVAYQRSTVIISELVFGAALLSFSRAMPNSTSQSIIIASAFMHPGLLLIDHIHFQYNGFLFGILLWSIFFAQKGNQLASGILFAILLNFKHIFMYLAPAYFVYLLRSFCMSPRGYFLPQNFISLGSAVALVFAISFGPFIFKGQLAQLLSRLFPFNRGLNHAYWAPNAWALVTAADRALIFGVKKLGLPLTVKTAGAKSASRGLIGDTVFGVLPEITPLHTFAITLLFHAIILVKLWTRPNYRSFLTALILSAYASFLFGWHVHEKAVMLILIPLSLLVTESHKHFRVFLVCSSAGIFSLLPLIFTATEEIIVTLYSILWSIFVFRALKNSIAQIPGSFVSSWASRLERLYLYGIPMIKVTTWLMTTILRQISRSKDHTSSGSDQPVYEFLPLMLISVYCAVGMCWGFFQLTVLYIVN